MAGAIKSVINLAFNVEGAKRARDQIKGIRDETEHLNKQQTRLGQTSASAGRHFSAQSNGLGGLVAAYAGAAATIFAVQQAFSALQKAAQTEQIISGTRALAGAIGQSGDAIIAKVQQITKSQLTMAEAAQNINIALSAGFNQTQIEGLTSVSLKASRALGRNLTDALQRVIRGTSKLEPELLDELGIFTRIDPAVEKYAQSLNRSVTSLTEFERRQAFVNAAITEGERKFGNIDTTTGNAQESLEKFSATILNIGTFFGTLIADALKPFVDFFSDDIGNALLAFGALASIVFAKAFSLAASGVGALAAKLQLTANSFANMTLKGTDAKEILEDIAESNIVQSATKGKGKLVAKGSSGAAFNAVKALQSGNLDAAQAVEQLSILKQEKALLDSQIPVLKEKAKTNKRIAEQLEVAKIRQQNISKIIDETGPKLDGINTRTVRFANNFKKVTTNVAAFATQVGILASRFLGIVGIITALSQVIGQAFGVDLLGEAFDFIKRLVTEAKTLNRTLEAIGNATTSSSFASATALLSEDEIKDVNKSIINSISNAIKSSDFGKVISRSTIRLSAAEKEAFTSSGMKVPEQAGETIRESLNIDEAREMLKQKVMKELANDSIALAEAIRRINEEATFLAPAFAQVNKIAGTTIQELTTASKQYILDNNEVFVSLDGISQKIGELGENGVILTKGQESYLASVIASDAVYQKFIGELESGNINAEAASLRLINAQNQYNEALKSENGTNVDTIAVLKRRLDIINREVNAISLREKFQKDLNTQLGKEIKLMDTLFISGKANLQGEFAKNELEVAKNRANLITETIDKGKDLVLLQRKGKKLDKEQLDLATAANTAIKASIGFMVKLILESEKIVKQEEKRLRSLTQQKLILDLQIALQQKQADLELQKTRNSNTMQIEQQKLSIMQEQINIQEQSVKLAEQRANAELLILDATIARLNREKSSIERSGNRALTSARGQGDITIARDRRADRARDFGRFFGPNNEELRNRAIRDEDTSLKTELKILQIRENLAKETSEKERQIIEAQKLRVEKELQLQVVQQNLANQEQTNRLNILNKESELTKQQIQNTISQLEGQKNLLMDQEKLQLQQIANDQATKNAEFDLITERLNVLDKEAEIFQKLPADLADIFNQAAKAFAISTNTDPSKLTPISLSSTATASSKEARDAVEASRRASNAVFDARRKQTTNNTNNRTENIQEQINGQKQLLDTEEELRRLREQSILAERDAKLQAILNEKNKLREELKNLDASEKARKEILRDTIEGLETETQIVLETHRERVDALNKEKDIISDLGELVSDNLTSAFNDFFNTIFTEVIDGTKTVGDAMRDLFRGIITKLIEDITQKLIVENLSNAASGILSALFSSGGSVKAFAGGGLVENFASGGAKRDSVPAMLEPGEFVLRKRAVQQLGINNVRDMNRGNGSGGMTPQINIINKGTPQTTEGTPKVDFNGKQIVIDIVTTDLRNNGPIRKSIQGMRK